MSKNKWKKINYTAKEYKFQQDKQKKRLDFVIFTLSMFDSVERMNWTTRLADGLARA